MPAGLEVIAGQATAPSATFTALTMNAGNTLTIRNAALATDVRLVNMWAKHQTAGVFRVRSPKLHDNVQGIRMRNPSASVIQMMPWNAAQKLVPQDNLIAEITGSATAGQFEQGAMLVYYQDLPGQMARLTTANDIQKRGVNVFTVESTITPSALGGYSGSQAFNANFDQFKANTDYALLGYRVDVRCTVVRWLGIDTGNLGVGGPGEPLVADVTANWFVLNSINQNLPMVPVFNSANKFGITVDVMQDQAAAVTKRGHAVADRATDSGLEGG
jgi:hypothetical protein